MGLLASLEPENLAEAPNVPHFIAKPHDLPYSLISYKLILNDPGAEAKITLYLSQPAPVEGKWYKYDPIFYFQRSLRLERLVGS